MEKREKIWLGVLIAVALAFNIVTLTPLIPWQEWMLWSSPAPTQTFTIQIEDYRFEFPRQTMEVKAGEYVEFVATSQDVTYGFGVFRKDGTMVFQMQVVPGHENEVLWEFNKDGVYDIRSTEYSGPEGYQMIVPESVVVSGCPAGS